MSKINERLDHLKLEIQKPEFLEGQGLSNEVNIRKTFKDVLAKIK